MQVSCHSLLAGAQAARGVAVIIDVFRAFTCAPLLFSLGVPRIILAATAAEAFALKRQNPNLLLVGEVGGIPIEGFDLGNSPSQILKTDPSFFPGQNGGPAHLLGGFREPSQPSRWPKKYSWAALYSPGRWPATLSPVRPRR